MTLLNKSAIWKSFAVRFVLPTAVTITLFVISFYAIIIPAIENSSMERKREMIRELTNSAWNILAKLEYDERKGLITRKTAQEQAIEQIRNLHYGQEMKDYFWINDMHPRMIIHPYRTDLNGKDLTDYIDPDGKRVFVEFVKLVQRDGAGYVTYRWQWKDNEKIVLPKISYVKGFSPWGWIIGTGIYIDDVKTEVKAITRSLIEISLFILFIIALMLGIIIRHSYAALKKQQETENALRESEEKYRTLVESAAEGMLMAIDGKYMYSNKTIADLLEYSQDELNGMKVSELFYEFQDLSGLKHINDIIAGVTIPARFETRLRTKSNNFRDVILSATPISIGDRNGFMAVVTDITNRKKAEDALEQSEEKFRTIAYNLNIGIFRRSTGENPRFVEVNPAIIRLLGYKTRDELLAVPVSELLVNPDDRKNFRSKIHHNLFKRIVIKLRKKDGSVFTASIWEVMIKDDDVPGYYDGIMEDITEAVVREKEHEKLLSEMQTALMFFNQPLDNLPSSNVVSCGSESAIKDAIDLMEQQKTDILLVRDNEGNNAGVVTDHDLRKILINPDLDQNSRISEIMTNPVRALPYNSSIFESWLAMEHNKISHLFITGADGGITGVIHGEDVIPIRNYSPAILLWEIQNSSGPEEVINRNAILPYLITTLIDGGAKPENINHLTTIIIDTILQKFTEFAIRELGEPPVKFCFLVFGSEGRREQTLRTDQDNAIVYEDAPADSEDSVHSYFLSIGEKVCSWLDRAGYAFCEGENMAKNPQWCRPLSVWKRYFHQWVFTGTAEDLLRAKIFFDFRCGYGDQGFSDSLRLYLDEILHENNRFFQLLARNVLPLNPPIGFFGNFVVESVEGKRKAFNIKTSMMPIVDFARIYALKNKIHFTNTLERLNALFEMNILNSQNYQEIVQAYTYLMQIRLRIQAEAIAGGSGSPDNFVSPKTLTFIEQRLLKEIFQQTKNFQSRLSYDFTGQSGGV